VKKNKAVFLADLLNLEEECKTERAAIEDIHAAVCVSRFSQENSDAASGDDDHEDDADLLVPLSHHQVLAAVSTLQHYKNSQPPSMMTLRASSKSSLHLLANRHSLKNPPQ
jgi:hypothetical protein